MDTYDVSTTGASTGTCLAVYTVRSGRLQIVVLILILTGFVPSASPQLKHRQVHREAIKVIFLRELDRLPHTTFGLNWVSYLAELPDSKENGRVVKLSYRFLDQEPEIPEDFIDTSRLHKFMAVRDKSCDQPLSSLRPESRTMGPGPYEAPPEGAAIVACYAITPADYKWSKTLKLFNKSSSQGY